MPTSVSVGPEFPSASTSVAIIVAATGHGTSRHRMLPKSRERN